MAGPASLRRFLSRLARDSGGNILMIAAASMALLTFAMGFGIDYSRAQRLQTRLNAAADAAVLAAVDPAMLNQSDATAKTAAQAMFDQQVTGLQGLTITSRTVTITDTSGGSLGTLRSVSISWQATSGNIFTSVLGKASLPIGGSASASASQPPSMNFTIALDTSPSMLLPTTSSGITNLIGGAIWSGEGVYFPGHTDGCDFACHANNMQEWNAGVYVVDSAGRPVYLNNGANAASVPFYRLSCSGTLTDNAGNALGSNGSLVNAGKSSVPNQCNTTTAFNQYWNPTPNPVYIYYLPTGKSNTAANYAMLSVNYPDTWWLAQNYASVNPGQSQINLRTDDEGTAAAGVIQYAYNVEQQYAAANVPPVYKMQFYTWNVGTPAALSTSPFGTMTDVATLQGQTFPNLGANAPLMCANSYWTSCGTYTANADSSFAAMLTAMQAALPTSAGAGTPASPQSVLILITDGANDDGSGMGELSSSVIAQCTAIKNAGTRIAILYTEYLPTTINYTANPTFNSFASGHVPSIAAQLQACATQNTDGTYLMQTVSTDGSVSAALNTLFAMVVQTARLTH